MNDPIDYAWIVGLLVGLTVWAAVIYTVVHFVIKLW